MLDRLVALVNLLEIAWQISTVDDILDERPCETGPCYMQFDSGMYCVENMLERTGLTMPRQALWHISMGYQTQAISF